ncbi:XPG i-region domain-containing protein [Ceratobasidium sp. AG-Ba]|nr:XPG i-region domain-containing protein [Ceratobasidium sp. AG-Ba]
MGVPGLWDLIRHTGKPQALAQLALQGFRRDAAVDPLQGLPKDTPHPRALRIGIDASIWFFHAAYGREGENPELRTLFFRLAKLATFTFCPLFVFDGPQRPKTKRGKTINTKMNSLAPGMKNMISAFGFEWRTAPGEAEAELAYLNNIGVIDAILSDDVDNFLFGARVVIRNPSGTLSGNRSNPVLNKQGKDDGMHVMVYRAEDIEKDPACRLTQGGMILIGLLSGGDYDSGAKRCGPKTALALAQMGLGDELLDAFRTLSPERFADYVPAWKDAVVEALRSGCATVDEGFEGEDEDDESQETAITASQGEPISASQRSTTSISASQQKAKKTAGKAKGKKPPARRQPALAAGIAASDFPDLTVLREYCAPWTSERAFSGDTPESLDEEYISASQGSVITSSQQSTTSNSRSKKKRAAALTENSVGSGGLTSDVRIGWTGELALGALGRICEQYFEWGVREIIQNRFRTLLWPAVVLRVLRRAIMEQERIREAESRAVTPRPLTPTRKSAEPIVPGTPRRLVNKHFGGGADSDSESDSNAESGYVRSKRQGGDTTPKAARRIISMEGNQVDTRQLLQAVKGEREHVTTDGLRELRVEVAPKHLARLAVRELLGTRDPALLAGTMFDMEGTPKGDGDEDDDNDNGDEESIPRRLKMVDPAAPVRVWVPAELVEMVHPELIRAWEDRGTKSKSRPKAAAGSTARRKTPKDSEAGTGKKGGTSAKSKARTKEKEKVRVVPTTLSGDEIEDPPVAHPVTSRGSPPCEPPPKAVLKPRPVNRPSDELIRKDKVTPRVVTLSGDETEVAVRPVASSSKIYSKPKSVRADSGSRTKALPSARTRLTSPTPDPRPVIERLSSPPAAPERSLSPEFAHRSISSRPLKSGPSAISNATRKPSSRIPGVVDVPSPPRRNPACAGPASDSSELEDVSFRALLARPKKHSVPEPDSDSEPSEVGKPKSPRHNRSHTSPRVSSGSEADKTITKPIRPPSNRKSAGPKLSPPIRRPTTRSQSSSGSEIEILDSPPARPPKHKNPELVESRVADAPSKTPRKSHKQTSPRVSSASEGETEPKTSASKKPTFKPSVPVASGSRTKTCSGLRKSNALLKRVVDTVIDLGSSSDDSFTILPTVAVPKASARLGPATERLTRPGELARLRSASANRSSSKSSMSGTGSAADTSVIDLLSD